MQGTDPSLEQRLKYYRDQNGKLIATIRSQSITEVENIHLIDSLRRALKIKSGTIKTVERIVLQTDTIIRDGILVEAVPDSTVILKQDSYLYLKAVANKEGNFVELRHIDTLLRIQTERRPLLGQPFTEVHLRSASPYNQIQSGFSFSVPSRRPLIVLGPVVNYDPFQRKFSFGVGLSVPLLTFYR